MTEHVRVFPAGIEETVTILDLLYLKNENTKFTKKRVQLQIQKMGLKMKEEIFNSY